MPSNARTDIHSPVNLGTEDYEYVQCYDNDATMGGCPVTADRTPGLIPTNSTRTSGAMRSRRRSSDQGDTNITIAYCQNCQHCPTTGIAKTRDVAGLLKLRAMLAILAMLAM